MSAYLVNPGLVDALLSSAAAAGVRLIVPGDCTNDRRPLDLIFSDAETCTEVGRILLEANAESLAHRYGADDDGAAEAFRAAEAYAFVPYPPQAAELSPARIVMAAHCYAYQSCEHDGWNMSLAQWIVARIESAAAFKLANGDGSGPAWGGDFFNPARGPADAQGWESILPPLPEPGDTEAEAPAKSRAALLAKLKGEAPAIPLPADPEPAQEPAQEPETAGPKPEPETAAKAAQKRAKGPKPAKAAAKPAKAPAARKSTPKGGGTASPPAAAPRKARKAPQTA